MRPRTFAVGALLFWLAGALAGQAFGASLDYAIKGAYLTKFAPFIEWPATVFESPTSSVVVCIVGDDPFGAQLDRTAATQQVGARSIIVRRMATARRDAGCHIMFIAGSDLQSVERALETMRGVPALTVTDNEISPNAHGVVHFVIDGKRVRFIIDNSLAAQNGVTISSKLLSLALTVKQGAS